MAVVIGELRLSFVWTQTLPALLARDPVGRGHVPSLGRKEGYVAALQRARFVDGTAVPLGAEWPGAEGDEPYSAPWPLANGRPAPHTWFWHNYLNKPDYENVAADRAWKLLVPLRVARALHLPADGVQGRSHLEAFGYPHGIALVATVSLADPGSLDATMLSAIHVRREARFGPSPPGGGPGQPVALARLAEWARGALEQALVGGNDEEAGGFGEPFSVATVIRGSGEPGELDVRPGEAVHRVLEGLTTFSPGYRTDPLHDLTVWQPEVKGGTQAGTLYRARRGRVVWVPGKIAAQGHVFSMGRYHRNLTLASMQTDSLLGLTSWAAGQLQQRDLTVDAEDLARNAASVLGRMNGQAGRRADAIYRTCSIPAQIADSGLVHQVNEVRRRLGESERDPLHSWYG